MKKVIMVAAIAIVGYSSVSVAQSVQPKQAAQPGADSNTNFRYREEWRRRRDAIVSRSVANRDKATRESSAVPSDISSELEAIGEATSANNSKTPVNDVGDQNFNSPDAKNNSFRQTRPRISEESANYKSQPFHLAVDSDSKFAVTAAGVSPTSLYLVGVGDTLNVRLRDGGGGGGGGDGREYANTLHSSAVLTGGLLDYPSLPKPLAVAGLTIEQVAAKLNVELRRNGVLGQVQVAVSISDYASHAVIVSGVVAEPGYKIMQREAIPLHVVVTDSRPQSGANRVSVKSYRTGVNHEFALSDQAFMRMLVYPGDVISVFKSEPQFYYVGGEVLQPGQKNFRQGLTLTEAVMAAGGELGETSRTASVKRKARKPVKLVIVTRQGEDGRLNNKRYDLKAISEHRLPDLLLQPGDRIEISK